MAAVTCCPPHAVRRVACPIHAGLHHRFTAPPPSPCPSTKPVLGPRVRRRRQAATVPYAHGTPTALPRYAGRPDHGPRRVHVSVRLLPSPLPPRSSRPRLPRSQPTTAPRPTLHRSLALPTALPTAHRPPPSSYREAPPPVPRPVSACRLRSRSRAGRAGRAGWLAGWSVSPGRAWAWAWLQ
jgi:hypothetical protein